MLWDYLVQKAIKKNKNYLFVGYLDLETILFSFLSL